MELLMMEKIARIETAIKAIKIIKLKDTVSLTPFFFIKFQGKKSLKRLCYHP